MAVSNKYDQSDRLSNLQQELQAILAKVGTFCSPLDVIRHIATGITSLGLVTRMCIFEFNNTMREVLPKLSPEQRDQVKKAASDYQLLLMTSQTFLSYTTSHVRRATTQEDIVKAVDINILQSLCDNVVNLSATFRDLQFIVQEKIQDEKLLKNVRNIGLLVATVATGILVIATGVGAAFGFSTVVNGILIINGTIVTTGMAVGGIAHAAQQLSAFEQVIRNLKTLKSNLAQLSQSYSKIRGIKSDLPMDKRNEFLDILNQAQNEVDQGFELLSTF